ncbi:MAG: Do family serine endopeptidase [Bryobacteraceae bacterium]
MSWIEKFKQNKFLSMTLMLATLATGIVIGTVITTGVSADKGEKAVTDATPLVLPSPSQLSNDFTALVKKYEPAVVNVSTEYQVKQAETKSRRKPRAGEEEEDEDGMEMFRRFFRGFPDQPNPTPRRGGGTGSGFIVDPKGYIITNQHVVDSATKLTVKLHSDNTEHKAKLIGVDKETDLAVIKIETDKALPFVPVGNSDGVQVGDWAIAIGSPFGLEASVTVGIVSAKGRDIPGAKQFQRFIQTDAAINPGNSGGPLLNIRGEVIGVNTMIATNSGGYQGIGFALPVNTAVKVYNQLIKSGKVTRGSIGISWNKGDEKGDTLKALGASHGVLVQDVEPKGPSERAGVKKDDIIVAVNGKSVMNGDELVAKVADTPIGDKITLTVDRDGKKMDMPVTVEDRAKVFARLLGDKPSDADEAAEDKASESNVKFGISVRAISPNEREEMKLEAGRGVVVTRVQEDSFAAEIGLRSDDVITAINRKPVASIEDIRKIQATLKAGDAVAFRVSRANPMSRNGQAGWASFYLSGTLPKE